MKESNQKNTQETIKRSNLNKIGLGNTEEESIESCCPELLCSVSFFPQKRPALFFIRISDTIQKVL